MKRRLFFVISLILSFGFISCYTMNVEDSPKYTNFSIKNESEDQMIVIAQNENGDWIWNRWVEIPAGVTVSIRFTDIPTNKVTLLFDTEATDAGLFCKKGFLSDFEIEEGKLYKMSFAFGSGFRYTVENLKK